MPDRALTRVRRCGDPLDDADAVETERLAELVGHADPVSAGVSLVGGRCHGGHHGHHTVLEALAPAQRINEVLVLVGMVEKVDDPGGQLDLAKRPSPLHLLDGNLPRLPDTPDTKVSGGPGHAPAALKPASPNNVRRDSGRQGSRSTSDSPPPARWVGLGASGLGVRRWLCAVGQVHAVGEGVDVGRLRVLAVCGPDQPEGRQVAQVLVLRGSRGCHDDRVTSW